MQSIKRFKGQYYIYIFIIRVLQKAEKSQISSLRNFRKIMENCSKFWQRTTLLNFLSIKYPKKWVLCCRQVNIDLPYLAFFLI